jgi:nitrite reductase (NADH) small subunit/3-phenylpropionate/trans-cinnamate dioxygenase ferredoxin subunit
LSTQTFHTVARLGEIPEGQGRLIEVEGRLIAVYQSEGRYYATDDACPHAGAPLSDGLVADGTVICTWHGWQFSLEDGRHMGGSRCRVQTYPVQVVDDEIKVGV